MGQKNIVIWGAGRIGRGFVADLFYAAGYRIILVDQSPDLVAALRAAGRYTVVRAPGANQRYDQVISGFEALTTGQTEELACAVTQADLLAVAVFPRDIRAVAQGLVPGLKRRCATRPEAPLDILLCTNLPHAASQFRHALEEVLPPELCGYARDRIGVVDTLVIRMAPDPPASERERDPLLVWTNGLAEFPVDRRAFRGEIPRVPGIRLVEDMRAEEMRKLYTYNMCHAALAYLGALRGYTLTVECLADPEVRAVVESALDEVGRALQAEYGFARAEMARWNAGVLQQTDNPTLGDTVARHGADPRRKLRRADRLVGPALLAWKHGIAPRSLARAIAAGFLYNDPADLGATYVQEQVAQLGISAAVRQVCELTDSEADLAEMITMAYQEGVLNRPGEA